MLVRVASGRSRLALPVVAALPRAAHSGDHDLILGSDAFKRQLFGCAQHTRRSFCTHSSSAGIHLVAKQWPHQVIMLGILMERCLVSTDVNFC